MKRLIESGVCVNLIREVSSDCTCRPTLVLFQLILRGFIEKKLVGGGMDQSLVDTCTQEGHYKSIACKKALTL